MIVRSLVGLAGAIGVPVALFVTLGALESALSRVRRTAQGRIRPWIWLAPALVLMTAILIYPLVDTIRLSLFDATGTNLVGFANYSWALTDRGMRAVLRNNLYWVVLLPLVTVSLGVVVAVLADRVRYERLAKGIIMLPTAISFVVGGVIWRLMYQYRPPGSPQTGTLNAILAQVAHAAPIAWLIDQRTNTFALVFVGVWMSLGLATILLSAAVKAVPRELLEAARLDGATERQVFRHVILPAIWPTVALVATTLLIAAGKVFDIVYVMTNGNFNTDVIGNRVFTELFINQHYGRASAIAVLLFVLVVPVVLVNARRFRRGEATG